MITEVEFVKNLKSSSPEALFESVITLSHTGKSLNYYDGDTSGLCCTNENGINLSSNIKLAIDF